MYCWYYLAGVEVPSKDSVPKKRPIYEDKKKKKQQQQQENKEGEDVSANTLICFILSEKTMSSTVLTSIRLNRDSYFLTCLSVKGLQK